MGWFFPIFIGTFVLFCRQTLAQLGELCGQVQLKDGIYDLSTIKEEPLEFSMPNLDRIVISLCYPLTSPCTTTQQSVYATVTYQSTKACETLFEKFDVPPSDLFDVSTIKNENGGGLSLSTTSSKYSPRLTYNLICTNNDKTTFAGVTQDGNELVATFYTKAGCNLFDQFRTFIKNFKIPIAATLFLIGISQSFFGFKLFKGTIAIVVFVSVSAFCLIALTMFAPTTDDYTWVTYIYLLFSAVLASLASILAVNLRSVGFFVIGKIQ
eukprot:TRINITY_DN4428_c0_g1_i5.p1 TRINITY_DN4428_c0_g1~~TRINITY_DN4428_c0_g1_i5.p1  ORF type:complete len:267 (-),score=35.25 TRINITY_DN4428_c0_g1_i5:571-1371(-)